jgi:hypothetical protein
MKVHSLWLVLLLLYKIGRGEKRDQAVEFEQKILQALKDIQVTSAFSDDEITDLSTVRGVLPRNKTGDLLIEVEGHNDVTIGLEIKLDKGVKLGQMGNRDPAAQTDTAIGQLLEMRTNRETDANAIVFDEDSMDATVPRGFFTNLLHLTCFMRQV